MNSRPSNTPRSAAGLSLIELMIAMAIGVVLLLGLVQVMSASRAAYQLSTGVARTQENARFAVDFIQRDVRMAGHMGCVNDQAHMSPEMPGASDASRQGLNLWFLTAAQRTARNYAALNTGANVALRFDLGVQGYEASTTAPGDTAVLAAGTPVAGNANQWSPALPTAIANLGPIAGSDIIVVRFLSRDGVPASLVSSSATSYTITPDSYGSSVSTTNSTGLFGLADCKQASIFASKTVNATSGALTVDVTGLNASGLIGDEWGYEGAANKPMLFRAETVVYYVAAGAGTNADGTRPPALFRARAINDGTGFTFVAEELVEGIETIQLLYGMDEHLPANLPRGNVERMRIASAVSNSTNPDNTAGDLWRRVGTVQVGLLMRSADRSRAQQSSTAPKVLGVTMKRGATDTTADGHYRSVYETTVALRNRLFGN
ncbi:PilW family protein [Lysobacter sp. S4-A87]|uniref:PilW family protein n=1 Tax=Lysobacter sp. S4-A87 TaxID=2925843 RepID=UPI001F52E3ED|nr:PilW family protein [Lysobacter sp. S4-A87]UNK50596.1 PilW family protein [Lysobacter sp. S4-A87]